MTRIAFSTVATPNLVLPVVAQLAAGWGFHGLELRTFGSGSRDFACDPALTDPAKTRDLLAAAGLHAACLATGVAFDEPIRPPVIGRIKDTEASIRRAKEAIDLAATLACPYVRVFGFQIGGENRQRARTRIARRLALAADAARNSGVKLVVENGGSFRTSADLLDLIGLAGSPLVGASYSLAVAQQAGEDAVAGAEALHAAGRLWVLKLKDRHEDGHPCLIGDGVVPCAQAVAALARAGYSHWATVEWDRAWIETLAPADHILPDAAARLIRWIGQPAALIPSIQPALV
ncbi:MAG: TIM barrel protein [Phycisphaerales bacterium]